MALQRQMESSQQRQTRFQDIQLIKQFVHSWRHLNRGHNFILYLIYSSDFHEGRQHFITLLMLVLDFAF